VSDNSKWDRAIRSGWDELPRSNSAPQQQQATQYQASGPGCGGAMIHVIHIIGLLFWIAWPMSDGETSFFVIAFILSFIAITADYARHYSTGCGLTWETHLINVFAWISLIFAVTTRSGRKPIKTR
jgi:hypothetical protein